MSWHSDQEHREENREENGNGTHARQGMERISVEILTVSQCYGPKCSQNRCDRLSRIDRRNFVANLTRQNFVGRMIYQVQCKHRVMGYRMEPNSTRCTRRPATKLDSKISKPSVLHHRFFDGPWLQLLTGTWIGCEKRTAEERRRPALDRSTR